MAIDLDGAVACVTGGARGIGRATAAALRRRGARVVLGDIDGALAEAVAAELGAVGVALDVADPASFASFVAVACDIGPVDLLVNNAGIMRTGPFVSQPAGAHHRELAVNLGGVVTGMSLVLPTMLERNRGHVVNVASMAGKITTPGAATYAASKFAVVALSRTVRAELSGTRVTVSTVLPAAVRTDLHSGLDTALMPVAEPVDVARAIIASCAHARAEIGVPRWVPPIGQLVEALPQRLGEGAKRLAGAQERIAPDNPAARSYQQRISGPTA